MTSLPDKVAALVAARGRQASFHPLEGNVRLQDESDGTGPFIAHWDEKTLGPRPTAKEGFAASELRTLEEVRAGFVGKRRLRHEQIGRELDAELTALESEIAAAIKADPEKLKAEHIARLKTRPLRFGRTVADRERKIRGIDADRLKANRVEGLRERREFLKKQRAAHTELG